MRQVKRESLSEQVLHSIIEYIQENNLHVGDKLPTEEELSRLLQVSRTSVREAMKGLSINKTIESIPGKGTFLRVPISDAILYRDYSTGLVQTAKATIQEVMEVRTALELLAGDLAIERGTDEEVARVAESLDDLISVVEAGKPWAMAGTAFHIRIAEMSRNKLLLQTIVSLTGTVGRYKDEMFKFETEMEQSVNQHKDILRALQQRDKAALHKAILAHMQGTQADILKLIDANNAQEFL